MLLERLVDVEDCIPWLVEPGQKLVDDNEQVGPPLGREVLDHLALVGLGVAGHVVLPPLKHLRQLGFINLLVPLASVGRGNDDSAADEAGSVESLLVADRRQLAVSGDLPL